MELSLPILIIATVLLFSLNIFVLFLYNLEQKKNKRLLTNIDQVLTQNQQIIAEMNTSSSSFKVLLDRLLMGTTGIEETDKVKEQLQAMVHEAQEKEQTIIELELKQQAEVNEKTQAIIAETQKKAEEILTQALEQQKTMLTRTAGLDEKLQQQAAAIVGNIATTYKSVMDKKIEEILKNYQDTIVTYEKEHIDLLQNVNKQIQDKAWQHSEEVFAEMRQRVIEIGKQREQYMEKQMQAIQKDLDEYKKQQLERIESNIYEILARASESVIGQAVSFDLHQELIIKALEQAKREGVFI